MRGRTGKGKKKSEAPSYTARQTMPRGAVLSSRLVFSTVVLVRRRSALVFNAGPARMDALQDKSHGTPSPPKKVDRPSILVAMPPFLPLRIFLFVSFGRCFP